MYKYTFSIHKSKQESQNKAIIRVCETDRSATGLYDFTLTSPTARHTRLYINSSSCHFPILYAPPGKRSPYGFLV